MSRQWLEYSGLSQEEARGDGWMRILHPGDRDQIWAVWREILRTGMPGEVEGRLRSHGGSYRWYLFRAAPLKNRNGEVVKWYGVNVDIDDLKRAETLLEGEKRLFEMIAREESLETILTALCHLAETLIEGAQVSILLMDEDGSRLRKGVAPSLPPAWTDAIDGGLIGPLSGSCGTAAFLGQNVHVADIATDARWVEYRQLALGFGLRACWSSPIFSSSRTVLGTFAIYANVVREITPEEERIIDQFSYLASIVVERKKAAEALHKSEALLAEAQSIAHIGYWERNLETDLVTWSAETWRIFGRSPKQEAFQASELAGLIHPEDLELVAGAVEDSLQGRARFNVEYRIIRPNGEERAVHSMGELKCDQTGRPLRMFGTVQDITERKRVESELRKSEERARQAQSELEHVSRTTTMGELTALVAHELNQPLSGVLFNAGAGLRWLEGNSPNLDKARISFERVLREGTRAGEIIKRIRKIFRKDSAARELLDVNQVAHEVIELVGNALLSQKVTLKLRLPPTSLRFLAIACRSSKSS